MMQDGIHPAWRLEEPWPTTLVAPLSDVEAPGADAVLAAAANLLSGTIDVLEIQPSIDEKHPWSLVVRVPDHPVPVLVACEKTKRMDEIPDPLRPAILASKWSLVIESLVSEEDPLGGWSRLSTLAGSRPETIAIIDATTGRWFDRREIDDSLLDQELGPPEDVLWRVQAVSSDENLEEGTVWLFTRGLLRCGLPELELLELPGRHAAEGARLLDAMAGLLLEDGAPPPEIPYPLGPDLSVVLVSWAQVAATLDPESLGSEQDRIALSQETPNPLRARRAAICGLEPKGSFRPIWTWPEEAIRVLGAPEVAIYRSDVSTNRSASLARRRWPEAVAAYASARGAATDPSLVLLAGVPVGDDGNGRVEHGWLQVEDADPSGGTGRLLRSTIDGRSAGTEVEFTADLIDGWRLVRGAVAMGPEDPGGPGSLLDGSPS